MGRHVLVSVFVLFVFVFVFGKSSPVSCRGRWTFIGLPGLLLFDCVLLYVAVFLSAPIPIPWSLSNCKHRRSFNIDQGSYGPTYMGERKHIDSNISNIAKHIYMYM